jgi:hypothetical protein
MNTMVPIPRNIKRDIKPFVRKSIAVLSVTVPDSTTSLEVDINTLIIVNAIREVITISGNNKTV